MRPKIIFGIVLLLACLPNLHSQEITMFRSFLGYGHTYYQDSTPISRVQVDSLLSTYKTSSDYWHKAKEHNTIFWMSTIVLVGSYAWTLSSGSLGEDVTFPAITSLVSAGMTIGFFFSAQSLRRKAILHYNERVTNQSYHQIRPTSNGIGIVFTF